MTRRELLVELGYDESIVFENPDYDSAIIGYDVVSGRVIYDYDLLNKAQKEYERRAKHRWR